MLNIKERPYGLLLFTAITLSMVIVFLTNYRSDIHDKSMFNVPLTVFIWLIPLFLIAFWALYLLTKRFLFSKLITWTHVLITVSTTILTVVILFIGINPLQPASPNYFETNRVEIIDNAVRIVFLLFVFGQFTFLTNILIGLLKIVK